jgi:hypothetical protein
MFLEDGMKLIMLAQEGSKLLFHKHHEFPPPHVFLVTAANFARGQPAVVSAHTQSTGF